MGLSLAAPDVAALETRTEGWIAALQLAALSMQGRDDVASFIADFAGDDRYIVDFLIEEVLNRQPEPVRDFLLQTAILRRLSGALCDAVTAHDGGKAMLEALDRANLFLVPLDDRRRWYRYHQLFADVLHVRLLDEQPDRVPDLHRRASEWYEQNGEPSEAIRHALAADDVERAADLIERAIPAMRSSRQEAVMLSWLQALPDEVIAARPVLSVHFAGALLVNAQVDGAEAHLRNAERWLDVTADGQHRPTAPAAPIVVDEDEFRRLPRSIAVYRAALAMAAGDLTATLAHARRALDLVEADDHIGRGSAAGFLGLVNWTSGDLEAASESWTAAIASLLRGGTRVRRCRLHDRARGYPDGARSARRRVDHVRAGTGPCRPAERAGAARGGGHACRDERGAPRAERSCRGEAAPAVERGARRADGPRPERLSLACRDGSSPGGRGRPRSCARAPRRGGTAVRE